MKTLTLTLLLILPAALWSQSAAPTRAFETSLSGVMSIGDDFGGLAQTASLGLTFAYLIGPQSQLGVTLVRATPWVFTGTAFYQFAYGLEYKHFWNPTWAELGPWQPWVSYSLLVDQGLRSGVTGRGIAHQTRLSLGTDLTLADNQRLTAEAGASESNYASFGVKVPPKLLTASLGLGWRVLF